MGIALIMAIALSLDGFGVGIAYGLKRIKIPLGSMLVIGGCTALAMTVSMGFGQFMTSRMTFISPKIIGAVILIMAGCYQFYQSLHSIPVMEETVPAMATLAERQAKPLFSINLSLFGLVIQVLKTPVAADIDRSGTISAAESVVLGVALALDSFAAGIAASMTGIEFYVIFLVTMMQIIMIWSGQSVCGKLPVRFQAKVKLLPGLVLVLIGSLKLI